MDRNEETYQTWNKIANLYESRFMTLSIYNESYDYFLNLLETKKSKILEIGCGPGNISAYLLSKRDDIHLYGIDVAENMIELAIKNTVQLKDAINRVEFKVLDCRNILEINSKFDAIIGGFCIPYLSFDEVSDLISNCNKLLNFKGCLYLSFVEGNPENSGFQVGSSGDRIYFHYHQLIDIENALAQNHFKVLEVREVEYQNSNLEIQIHTIVIAQMKS